MSFRVSKRRLVGLATIIIFSQSFCDSNAVAGIARKGSESYCRGYEIVMSIIIPLGSPFV